MNNWILFDADMLVCPATGRALNISGNKIGYYLQAKDPTAYHEINYSSPDVALEKWRTLTQLLAAPFGTFTLKE